MSIPAQARFAVKKWDESAYIEPGDGSKCTRSYNIYSYEGDITGESHLEYLMYYRPDKSGTLVGIERIVGSVVGKNGTFMIQHIGTFSVEGVEITWEVVPGSGTDALVGLRGRGTISLVGHMEAYPTDFEYSFE